MGACCGKNGKSTSDRDNTPYTKKTQDTETQPNEDPKSTDVELAKPDETRPSKEVARGVHKDEEKPQIAHSMPISIPVVPSTAPREDDDAAAHHHWQRDEVPSDAAAAAAAATSTDVRPWSEPAAAVEEVKIKVTPSEAPKNEEITSTKKIIKVTPSKTAPKDEPITSTKIVEVEERVKTETPSERRDHSKEISLGEKVQVEERVSFVKTESSSKTVSHTKEVSLAKTEVKQTVSSVKIESSSEFRSASGRTLKDADDFPPEKEVTDVIPFIVEDAAANDALKKAEKEERSDVNGIKSLTEEHHDDCPATETSDITLKLVETDEEVADTKENGTSDINGVVDVTPGAPLKSPENEVSGDVPEVEHVPEISKDVSVKDSVTTTKVESSENGTKTTVETKTTTRSSLSKLVFVPPKKAEKADTEEVKSPLSPSSRLPVFSRNDDATSPGGKASSSIARYSSKEPRKSSLSSNGKSPSSEEKKIPSSPATTPTDKPTQKMETKQEIYLPDFTPANEFIKSCHQFLSGTRGKLMGCLDKWVNGQDENKPKLRLIWGKSGMGKTCLVSELCSRHQPNIAACHFFHHCATQANHNDPRLVICSLANQLRESIPGYEKQLAKNPNLEDLVSNGSIDELWSRLIAEPLCSPELQAEPEKTMVIILESLDDCKRDGQEDLLKNINNFAENSPDWLRMLVTTRDNNKLRSHLESASTVELKTSNDNTMDIKRYLRNSLSPYMDRISLDGGLTQLAKKAEGNFLCAHLYSQKLHSFPSGTKIALREIEGRFSTGYQAMLAEVFQAFYDHCKGHDVNSYGQILSVLINLRGPLHESFISQFTDQELVDVLEKLKPVLIRTADGEIAFSHCVIRDWLLNDQLSGHLAVQATTGRTALQEFCVKWLSDMLVGEEMSKEQASFQAYALKHGITHMTEVPNQQENVAKFLCSLKYINQKLNIENITYFDLDQDYCHSHDVVVGEKTVTLTEYMKKQPRLTKEINVYQRFVNDNRANFSQRPVLALHAAANYKASPKLQKIAKTELGSKPFLEDLGTPEPTSCVVKAFPGKITTMSLSNDKKTLAFCTDDSGLKINLLTVVPDMKGDFKTFAMPSDAVGSCIRFLGDGNIFVGSLSTVVSSRGKSVPFGLDLRSVVLKDKYSVECFDASDKHLACGVSTLPHGGRTLNMIVFDLKTKKCAKTLEVFQFRFGGSVQFGVRCCAINSTDTQLTACFKHVNKPQLKATVWDMSKWTPIHTTDINSDTFSRCAFLKSSSILFGSSELENQSNVMVWNAKESSVKAIAPEALRSVFHVDRQGNTTVSSWTSATTAYVSQCRNGNVQGKPDQEFMIHGINLAQQMVHTSSQLVYAGAKELISYEIANLDKVGSESPSMHGLAVTDVTYLPRSDDALISHKEHGSIDKVALSVIKPFNDKLEILSTTVGELSTSQCDSNNNPDICKCFCNPDSVGEFCSVSADGETAVVNNREGVLLWDRASNSSRALPTCQELADSSSTEHGVKAIASMASPKENILAVVYAQHPNKIYVIDLKTLQVLQQLELQGSDFNATINRNVSDFTFLPSNGFVISYHLNAESTLAFWNQRSGKLVSSAQGVPVSYAKPSAASDRLAVSLRCGEEEGELLLRNSDGRVNILLPMDKVWHPSIQHSDVSFSQDGTVIIGISGPARIFRTWNVGNGEVLKDLDISSVPVQIVGMPSNTHVMIYDGSRLVVVDIASMEVEAIVEVKEEIGEKTLSKTLKISPRGNYLMGAAKSGKFLLYRCHNLSSVKRKTTLQRMKSFC